MNCPHCGRKILLPSGGYVDFEPFAKELNYPDAETMLRHLYLDRGIGQIELAEYLGCATSTVIRRLRFYDIRRPEGWRAEYWRKRKEEKSR